MLVKTCILKESKHRNNFLALLDAFGLAASTWLKCAVGDVSLLSCSSGCLEKSSWNYGRGCLCCISFQIQYEASSLVSGFLWRSRVELAWNVMPGCIECGLTMALPVSLAPCKGWRHCSQCNVPRCHSFLWYLIQDDRNGWAVNSWKTCDNQSKYVIVVIQKFVEASFFDAFMLGLLWMALISFWSSRIWQGWTLSFVVAQANVMIYATDGKFSTRLWQWLSAMLTI